jgi:hypothetical protein
MWRYCIRGARIDGWLVGYVLNVTALAVRDVDFTPIRSEEEYYKRAGKGYCEAPFQFPDAAQSPGYSIVSETLEEDGNTTFQVQV